MFFTLVPVVVKEISLCLRVLLNIPYISLPPLSRVDTRSCDFSLENVRIDLYEMFFIKYIDQWLLVILVNNNCRDNGMEHDPDFIISETNKQLMLDKENIR